MRDRTAVLTESHTNSHHSFDIVHFAQNQKWSPFHQLQHIQAIWSQSTHLNSLRSWILLLLQSDPMCAVFLWEWTIESAEPESPSTRMLISALGPPCCAFQGNRCSSENIRCPSFRDSDRQPLVYSSGSAQDRREALIGDSVHPSRGPMSTLTHLALMKTISPAVFMAHQQNGINSRDREIQRAL